MRAAWGLGDPHFFVRLFPVFRHFVRNRQALTLREIVDLNVHHLRVGPSFHGHFGHFFDNAPSKLVSKALTS